MFLTGNIKVQVNLLHLPTSANIVLIVSNLLIVKSIICCKNQKHFNQFTMSLLFCVYCFIEFSWSPLPLRSAQSRCPLDLLWSSLRYGRCKADIHRMSCTLVFALIRVRKHWWDDITQGKQ